MRPRVQALAINEVDATASLEAAREVAPRFGIANADARAITAEVGHVVRGWRSVAGKFGLKPRDLDRMESAFQHRDLEDAAGGKIGT